MSRVHLNPGLQGYLNLGIALSLGLLLAMASVAGYSAWRFQTYGNRLLRIADTLQRVENYESCAVRVQNAARGYVLTGHLRFLEAIEHERAALDQEGSALAGILLAGEARWAEHWGTVSQSVERLVSVVAEVVRLRREVSPAAAEAYVASGQGQAMLEAFTGAVAVLQRELEARRQGELERVHQTSRTLSHLLIGGFSLNFVLIGLVLVGGRRYLRARQEAEREQAEARQKADDIIETLREFLVILTADLRVQRVNRSFCEAFATTPEAVADKPLVELEGGIWRIPALLTQLDRVAVSDEAVDDIAVTVPRPGGGERILLANARRLRGAGGGTARLLLAMEDITVRREAETEVRRLNETLRQRASQLEAMNAELEAFSYSVSHDLRAPLRHIEGFALLLRKHAGPGLDATGTRFAETIIGSARKLGVLIDELLQFSRLGRGELRKAKVDMRALAEEVWRELVEAETPPRRVSWRLGDLPVVEGDGTLLRQVWRNLLGNALKYTRRRKEAEIEVSHAGTAPDGLVFAVRDNGAGFDMQYAAKLFGVFQRLHPEREFEGTGVGLANVRRIVQRHGGRTWAEGRPGEGATFYFSLPAVNGQPTTLPTPSPP